MRRYSAPAAAQVGPEWVGVAVRFPGDESTPRGRWITFEYGPGAQVEMTQERPDYLTHFGDPLRVVFPMRLEVKVSGMPAGTSTWPNWFPGHRREETAADVAQAFDRAADRGVTRQPAHRPAPHLIGGDLVVGGARPRTDRWL